MACILHIETSTNVSSVALSKDGFLLYEKEDHGDGKGSNAAEKLGGFVDEALGKLQSPQGLDDGHPVKLDAVSVSSGPGSYTGLRIGVSMAKGICYGGDAKLISVPTLELLCVPVLLSDRIRCSTWVEGVSENITEELTDDALLCPMIDARRMEVYTALYDRELNTIEEVRPQVVEADTFNYVLDKHKVCFFGDGADKCKAVISHPNAIFIDNIRPDAMYMMPLAIKQLAEGKTEDTAYFEPFYLKEFVAAASHVKGLQ